MLLAQLFGVFFMIGCVSFGGGYAMVPLMEHEVTGRGWMSVQEFGHSVALAGMSPGPIGTNCAVFIGFHTAGLAGAVSAIAGMVLPSLVILVGAAVFFTKFHSRPGFIRLFYVLRPLIAGLVFYGAYRFASNIGMIAPISPHVLFDAAVFGLALLALIRFRMHPLAVIVLSGLAGAAIMTP
jgi:chromate transporter